VTGHQVGTLAEEAPASQVVNGVRSRNHLPWNLQAEVQKVEVPFGCFAEVRALTFLAGEGALDHFPAAVRTCLTAPLEVVQEDPDFPDEP